MNNNIKNFAIFMAGGVSGFMIAWFSLKTKYEKMADEEIASVKEAFSKSKRYIQTDKKESTIESPEASEAHKKNKLTIKSEDRPIYDYSARYRSNSNEKPKTEPKQDDILKPYVITPEEFNNSEYECQTLFYYADHILADDDYNVIGDVEGSIGYSALAHFGDYEIDSVYVRNDRLKIDFEVLLDGRNYCDISPSRTVVHPEDADED